MLINNTGISPVLHLRKQKPSSVLTGGTAAAHGSISGAASSRESTDETGGGAPLSPGTPEDAMASSAVVAAAGEELFPTQQRSEVSVEAFQRVIIINSNNIKDSVCEKSTTYT